MEMQNVGIPSAEFGREFVKKGKTTSAGATTMADRRDVVVVRARSRGRRVCSPILRRAARDGRPVHGAAMEVDVVAGGRARHCRHQSRDARSRHLV